MMKPKRIYLACPYWHEDPEMREERYQMVTSKTARLMELGYQVFSPITHSHPSGNRFGGCFYTVFSDGYM